MEPPKDATIAEFGCEVAESPGFSPAVTRESSPLTYRLRISPPRANACERRTSATSNSFLSRGPRIWAGCEASHFFSLIVLQHNPPPIICDILESAFDGLASGGIAFFQVPTYGLGYKFALQDYYEGQYNRSDMEIHFVPQHEIFRLFCRHDVSLLKCVRITASETMIDGFRTRSWLGRGNNGRGMCDGRILGC